MGVSSGSYFFSHINRIGSVMELKFYIRVQEEDIRVQEEFVLSLLDLWVCVHSLPCMVGLILSTPPRFIKTPPIF